MAIDYSKAKYKDTEFGGTKGILLPTGNTGERVDETPRLRYNSTTGLAEIYAASGWQPIDAPPVVTSISPTSFDGSSGTVITVNGSNFKSASTVKFITNGGTELNAGTTTFVSSAQVTATIPRNILVSEEPLDVKVVNPSGLAATLEDALDAGSGPTWVTGAGTLATISDEYGSYSPITTVSATDPDGGAVTYALSSGNIPAGTTLDTNAGTISGNPTNVGGTTTNNFTLVAEDAVGNQSTRSFSIIVNPAADGTSSARAASSASAILSLDPSATNGTYWLDLDGTARQFYCDMSGGGFILFGQWNFNGGSTSYAATHGYTGAPTTAVAAPNTSDNVWNSFGGANISSGNVSSVGAWQYQDTRGAGAGVNAWQRGTGATNANGNIAYYRPNNYGYNWTQMKFRMKWWAGQGSAAYNSIDLWTNVGYTNINDPYVEGVSVTYGNSSSRNHIYSWPTDGTGNGGGRSGSPAGFVGGNYTELFASVSTNDVVNTAADSAEISATVGSTNIPPEFRIMTDQDNANEDFYVTAYYVFMK